MGLSLSVYIYILTHTYNIYNVYVYVCVLGVCDIEKKWYRYFFGFFDNNN